MEICRARALRGPNLWADVPMVELVLDLADLPSEGLSDLCRRVGSGLRALLPGLAIPGRGTARARPKLELWLARTHGSVTLWFCARLGPRPTFSRIEPGPAAGQYRLLFPLREESVPEECAEAAVSIMETLAAGKDCDLPALLTGLDAAAREERLDPAAEALRNAAIARGIPVRRLGRLLILGQGARQRRTLDGVADLGGPAARAAADPWILKTLLRSVGVPCAGGPASGAHFRLLVTAGQVATAIHWHQGNGSGPTPASDPIHPELAAQVLDAARAVGLDPAEVRLIADSLDRPLSDQGGQVAEVLPATPLDACLGPDPAPAAVEAILDGLFPPGQDGRIPVLAVTGTNGKTTVARLLGHGMGLSGLYVGLACTDGIYLDGRRIDTDDCAGPKSARLILLNPQVEAAVLETARGGILREGLGFDRCDVAVVTNIGEGDHLGIGGIDTPEQLARVKETLVRAVAPWGTAVLNAADPLVAQMAERCPGRVLFFARDGAHPILIHHRRSGGRAAFVCDQGLILAEGDRELEPIPMERIPLVRGGSVGFQVENALAAAGALWSLGFPMETLCRTLVTFAADLDKSPGRFNVVSVNGAIAVFDYGHNTSALLAAIEALDRLPQGRRIAVYSAAGDRRDSDMIRQGEILGRSFDLAILYEDRYMRGREPGEIVALFRQGLARGERVREVQSVAGWDGAVDLAIGLAQPGDLLLVQADTVDAAVDYVRARLGADAVFAEPRPTGVASSETAPACGSRLVRA